MVDTPRSYVTSSVVAGSIANIAIGVPQCYVRLAHANSRLMSMLQYEDASLATHMFGWKVDVVGLDGQLVARLVGSVKAEGQMLRRRGHARRFSRH